MRRYYLDVSCFDFSINLIVVLFSIRVKPRIAFLFVGAVLRALFVAVSNSKVFDLIKRQAG